MVPGSVLTPVLLALLAMPCDARVAVDAQWDDAPCFHRLCGLTEPEATDFGAPSSCAWLGADSCAWPLAAEGAWQRFSATLVPVVRGGAVVSAARPGAQCSRGQLGLLAKGAYCFLCELRAARSSASPAVAKVPPAAPSSAAVQRSVPWRDRAPAGLLFSTVPGPSGRPEVSAASSQGPGTGDGLYVPESDTPELASVDPSGPGDSEGRSLAIELYLPGLGLRRLSVGHVSVSLIAIGCLTAVLRRRFRA